LTFYTIIAFYRRSAQMKIQVIGLGVVGGAQAYMASKLGHDVLGVDPKKTTFEYARVFPVPQTDVDVTFVCPPEAFVPGVINDLVSRRVKGLYVIKSTVPSGTTQALMKQHNVHICHNPEFLREETAFYDVVHPSSVVIGQCCTEHAELLKSLYIPLGCPVVVSQPTVTETVKLTLNSYLATLISFWNEIDKVTKGLGFTTKELAGLVRLNPRVSSYGTDFFGSPFGGKCLPKDLDQLIEVFHNAGADSSLLEAVRDFNKKL
jgi:UDPglucose 6-dehydrogenase